jgi:N-acetylglucosaminyldiphosphoundecaprenol N-acetyl-beta-D-mannosaminyltransferase
VGALAVTAFSEAELVDRLIELASDRGQPAGQPATTACYVNAHIFNLAWGDAEFRADLQRASLLWPDGVSGRMAMRWAGVAMPDRLTGANFFDQFNERLAAAKLRQFLLGGTEATVARAAERIASRHGPDLVAGFRNGYFPPSEDDAVIEQINRSGADVLTVGMSSPRQERWIVQYAGRLRPRLLWTVGALFDFWAGTERLAPAWMQRAGLEWLFRLTQDFSGKWRRYLLGNPMFLWRLLRRPPRKM